VTRPRYRRLPLKDESGSVLVISLVLVTVVAVVVGALLSYADTSMRVTVALRSQSADAATADGAAQAALNELAKSTYNNDLGSTVYPKCFGADNATASAEGDDVLALSNLIPGSTGGAANSAAVRCTPDPSTGASGDSVPITSANKPGNAILTLSTNAAENGLEVKALNASLPFNVHGGIISNSNINVTDGTLKSTVEVQANKGCTGTIISTPAPECFKSGLPGDPNYPAETTTVPTYRAVPANLAANCPGKVMTFEAGYYNDAAALTDLMSGNGDCKDSVWWFKPGEYYFDFQNTSGTHRWEIKSGQLIAGTPVNSSGTPIAAPSNPITVPGSCDNPIHSETAVGVQWLFGGDSQFQVVGTADAEICGSYHTDRPPLAIYGVKSSGTSTSGGGTGKTAGTVNATGWTPTTGSTAAQAVAATGDGKTITWSGASNSTTVNANAFSPTFNIPAGSTLTSAKLRITYVTGATGTTAVKTRDVAVTPTPGTVVNKSLSELAPTAANPTIETDLTTDLASTVMTKGLTAMHVGYTVTKTGAMTVKEIVDSIQLDLTWTGPAMHAQSGCITQVFPGSSGCAVISTTPSYSGHFYIQGTTYVPLAPIDLNLSNITAQVLRFGVISRVLRVKETGAVSYDGPVIEIPDNSPGYGPGGTVVLLEAYVCEASASCEPPGGADNPSVPDGQLGLRARVYIKDDDGVLGPTGGRDLIVQSWATQR
jgi:hypothetical protein